MKNSTKIKNKRKENIIKDNKINYFGCLNNSFQIPETNNKLKLKYSFIENIKLSNFKKSIILKINQIQNNQQKTNIKLSSLISILLSKLIGNKTYKLFHNHFSILQNKKAQNKNNKNFLERVKTEENHSERYNSNKKKIENISLASELEIKRYNLSNQKTKSKENIFRLNNEKTYKSNNKNNNYENEEFYNNSNNNLFRINNNYFNSLTKNSSTDNLNNSKKVFTISNNRKPITFNEITNNLNSPNNNYSFNYTNKNKTKNNENNFKKLNINEANSHYSKSDTLNSINSINKEKDINKTNISKGPVKIKLNPIEKPVLLMNFNESNDQKNNLNNIINISHNSNLNERKENKKYNNINDSKISTLKIENSIYNISNENEEGGGDLTPENMRGKRKFSESNLNHSHFSESKEGQGYSRKIRGFNFRNNIKFNKNPNSSKISDEAYNKIKGGSVRYSSNEAFFEKINSLENENK